MQIHDDQLYSNHEAAKLLGFARNTLRNSRSVGHLAGVTPPPFLKMGSSVRYRGSALREWLAQFNEKTSTAA
jgi:predicted DNA-binding transcriptional regulator AlpA